MKIRGDFQCLVSPGKGGLFVGLLFLNVDVEGNEHGEQKENETQAKKNLDDDEDLGDSENRLDVSVSDRGDGDEAEVKEVEIRQGGRMGDGESSCSGEDLNSVEHRGEADDAADVFDQSADDLFADFVNGRDVDHPPLFFQILVTENRKKYVSCENVDIEAGDENGKDREDLEGDEQEDDREHPEEEEMSQNGERLSEFIGEIKLKRR